MPFQASFVVGVKLVLDEMHAPAVAGELRDRGYGAIAVKERPDLIGLSDDELLRAAGSGRVVVSENVKDFAMLHRGLVGAGQQHSGLVFTHQRRFARSRGDHVSMLADALSAFVDEHAPLLDGVESFVWLLERADS